MKYISKPNLLLYIHHVYIYASIKIPTLSPQTVPFSPCKINNTDIVSYHLNYQSLLAPELVWFALSGPLSLQEKVILCIEPVLCKFLKIYFQFNTLISKYNSLFKKSTFLGVGKKYRLFIWIDL